MAVTDKNTLKSYFQNGDSPDETNFQDLIDSLVHVAGQVITGTIQLEPSTEATLAQVIKLASGQTANSLEIRNDLNEILSKFDGQGKLGIGLAGDPVNAQAHIKGSNDTSADYSLKVDSSSTDNIFSVRNDGSIQAAGLGGLSHRMVEVDEDGRVSASHEFKSLFILNLGIQSLLEDKTNWDASGNYTGTAIEDAEQGQFHADAENIYLFTDSESPVKVKKLPDQLFIQTTDQTVENTTAETSILGTGKGTKELPADFLIEGKTIKVKVRGALSSVQTPNLTIKVKLGSTEIVASPALTVSSASNTYFEVECDLTCRSVGATGTVTAMGKFMFEGASQDLKVAGLIAPSPVTIDTTAGQILDVTASWSVADAGNSLQSTIAVIEQLVVN